jgi:hypothetical protein
MVSCPARGRVAVRVLEVWREEMSAHDILLLAIGLMAGFLLGNIFRDLME